MRGRVHLQLPPAFPAAVRSAPRGQHEGGGGGASDAATGTCDDDCLVHPASDSSANDSIIGQSPLAVHQSGGRCVPKAVFFAFLAVDRIVKVGNNPKQKELSLGISTAFVIHPDVRLMPLYFITPEMMLEEARLLVEAIGLEVSFSEVVSFAGRVLASFLSKGHAERLAALAEEADHPLIVINTALTPVQQRNLETVTQYQSN